MNRFASLLQSTSDRLDVPQPQKSRILLEMEGDLDDLFELYKSRGLSDYEAVKKAEEKFGADDETIELLIRMNESYMRKLLRKFSEKAQRRIEFLLWFSLMVVLGTYVSLTLFQSASFLRSSYFLWVITGITLLLFGVSSATFYRLYIKKDHLLSRLHDRLPLILFLGAQSLLLGITGFFAEMYGGITIMLSQIQNVHSILLTTLQNCFLVTTAGMLVAIGAFIIWFIFTFKTLSIEQREKDFLFDDIRI